MDPLGTFFHKAMRHFERIRMVVGDLIVVALRKADATSTENIDRGENQHLTKRSNILSPIGPLFSGWN